MVGKVPGGGDQSLDSVDKGDAIGEGGLKLEMRGKGGEGEGESSRLDEGAEYEVAMRADEGCEYAEGENALGEDCGTGEQEQVGEGVAGACGVCAVVMKAEMCWQGSDLVGG